MMHLDTKLRLSGRRMTWTAAAARPRSILATAWGLVVMTVTVAAADIAAADEQSPQIISKQTWRYYQEYAARRRPLAFAVSSDGIYSGYVYCDGYNCTGMDQAKGQAIGLCMQVGGRNCRIFAVYSDIKVPYKVMTLSSDLPRAPAPQPATPPAPDCSNKSEAECAAVLVRVHEQKRHAVEAEWAKKIDEIKDTYCRPSYSVMARCWNYVASAEANRDAELKVLDDELKLALGK